MIVQFISEIRTDDFFRFFNDFFFDVGFLLIFGLTVEFGGFAVFLILFGTFVT